MSEKSIRNKIPLVFLLRFYFPSAILLFSFIFDSVFILLEILLSLFIPNLSSLFRFSFVYTYLKLTFIYVNLSVYLSICSFPFSFSFFFFSQVYVSSKKCLLGVTSIVVELIGKPFITSTTKFVAEIKKLQKERKKWLVPNICLRFIFRNQPTNTSKVFRILQYQRWENYSIFTAHKIIIWIYFLFFHKNIQFSYLKVLISEK